MTRGGRTWPAWSAFAWGMIFGGLNLLWTAGVEWGIDHLAQTIQDQVATGDRMIMVANTIGGIGKIVLGVIALATILPIRDRIPRRLHLTVLYAAGIALLIYGGTNMIHMLLMETGIRDVSPAIGAANIRWYLFLWEPIWVVGGVLLILTAESYRRAFSSVASEPHRND